VPARRAAALLALAFAAIYAATTRGQFVFGDDILVFQVSEAILDVSRLPELRTWRAADAEVFLGAGVTYARILRELPQFHALAEASLGGLLASGIEDGRNLGTASPVGDAPGLAVHHAEIGLRPARGDDGWAGTTSRSA
jgi:xanthine dehydrogenase iron-sulfur cluster and FAD-binding subunit A